MTTETTETTNPTEPVIGDLIIAEPTADQLALFDYEQLELETRVVVRQRANEARDEIRRLAGLIRQTAETVWALGEKLSDVQERLAPDGLFAAWCSAELPNVSRGTIYNAINVYRSFPDLPTVGNPALDIPLKALYVLAAPGTPEDARDEALARASSGDSMTYQDARAIVQKHRPAVPDASGSRVTSGAPDATIARESGGASPSGSSMASPGGGPLHDSNSAATDRAGEAHDAADPTVIARVSPAEATEATEAATPVPAPALTPLPAAPVQPAPPVTAAAPVALDEANRRQACATIAVLAEAWSLARARAARVTGVAVEDIDELYRFRPHDVEAAAQGLLDAPSLNLAAWSAAQFAEEGVCQRDDHDGE